MTRYVLGYSGTLPYIGDVILVRWGLRYLVHEVVASKVLLSLFRELFRYWVARERLDIGNKVDSNLFNMAEPTVISGVAAKLLKIVVFGATGRTGKEVLKQALEKGHHVTAVVRTPEKVDIQWVNYLAAFFAPKFQWKFATFLLFSRGYSFHVRALRILATKSTSACLESKSLGWNGLLNCKHP